MTASRARRALRVAGLALLLVGSRPLWAQAQSEPKNVLMLLQSAGSDSGQTFAQSLQTRMQAEPETVFFGESFDFNRFPGTRNENVLRDYLDDKYADTELDLVLAVGAAPLRFMLAHGQEIFPGTTIAFSAVPGSLQNVISIPAEVTGLFGHFNVDPTLGLARRLQPDADRIVVVAGTHAFDQRSLAEARLELGLYADRFEIEYLSGLTIEETELRLSELSPDTIVILLTMVEDAAGQRFIPTYAATSRLAAASAAPVYGVYETQLGEGIVGVVGDDFEALGVQTGELVAALLSGTRPGAIPARYGRTRTLVDWRQMARFGLDESLLPPEAVVLSREPSIWQRYRDAILVVIGLLVLQSLLVLLLLMRSRQRRAERQLERSEARYREVLEAQDDAVCRFTADGTLTFVNAALCRRFGLTREALIGRQYMDLLPEPRRRMAIERISKMVEEPETREFDLEIQQSDGSSRWEHWVEHPIVDENGKVIEIQGTARDVTQLKNAEREARIQGERITHLTRVAILGEFSGALAHELNQPLTAIMSDAQAAQIMLSQDRTDHHELKEIMDDIVSNNRRARDIIIGLRKLLRGRTAEPGVIDVNELIRNVLVLVRSLMIDKNIVVSTDLASELPDIRGDEVQLQQVLLNLLMNASEAVDANDKSDRYIWLTTEQDENGDIRTIVRDNGPGIDAEIQGRLFEPYVTTKHDGLGLGLSICRTIVESHGGRLFIRGHEPQGACLEFVLPARVDIELEFEASDGADRTKAAAPAETPRVLGVRN